MAAFFCLILGLSGPCIDKKLESNQTEMVNMSFWPRTKLVFNELGEGLRIKELYTSLIFQMIIGCIVPQFTTYLYYYYIEVQKFENFTYALL
jgi:iron only hydrogenase large subunit-like protein